MLYVVIRANTILVVLRDERRVERALSIVFKAHLNLFLLFLGVIGPLEAAVFDLLVFIAFALYCLIALHIIIIVLRWGGGALVKS